MQTGMMPAGVASDPFAERAAGPSGGKRLRAGIYMFIYVYIFYQINPIEIMEQHSFHFE